MCRIHVSMVDPCIEKKFDGKLPLEPAIQITQNNCNDIRYHQIISNTEGNENLIKRLGCHIFLLMHLYLPTKSSKYSRYVEFLGQKIEEKKFRDFVHFGSQNNEMQHLSSLKENFTKIGIKLTA